MAIVCGLFIGFAIVLAAGHLHIVPRPVPRADECHGGVCTAIVTTLPSRRDQIESAAGAMVYEQRRLVRDVGALMVDGEGRL